jgi:multimeric flavodoxin WrbA
MKIIAFNGSPRREGNTELLLNETLRAIDGKGHEITRFELNKLKIMPCQDCGGCEKTGRCIIDDDMTPIYEAIRTADRVILASPIFFFALSAQAKVMIDRCQAFWCEKYLLKRTIEAGPFGRKGLLLMVGGMKRQMGVQCGEATAKAFFRTVSVQEHETLSFLEVDQKGAILSHPTALREAYEAGLRAVTVDTGL